MDLKLKPIERRVLGSLMEKSMTQPEYYPMTLNAIVLACNQKSNRNPAMELTDEAVWDTLESLRLRSLVGKILAAPGSRVDRFRHEVEKACNWEKPQRAIMTELLLRGPQTVGELRTRCSRMYAFEDIATVSAVLDSLAALDPPWVAPLPRAPGQSTIRYTHLLYPDEEQQQIANMSFTETASPNSPAKSAAAGSAMTAASAAAVNPDEVNQLRRQIQELQTEMAELYDAIADLGRRLDTLEGR